MNRLQFNDKGCLQPVMLFSLVAFASDPISEVLIMMNVCVGLFFFYGFCTWHG